MGERLICWSSKGSLFSRTGRVLAASCSCCGIGCCGGCGGCGRGRAMAVGTARLRRGRGCCAAAPRIPIKMAPRVLHLKKQQNFLRLGCFRNSSFFFGNVSIFVDMCAKSVDGISGSQYFKDRVIFVKGETSVSSSIWHGLLTRCHVGFKLDLTLVSTSNRR